MRGWRNTHRYNARVLVALNTILHDNELEEARRVAWQVYEAGADALIIRDMGLLEIDLPPIALRLDAVRHPHGGEGEVSRRGRFLANGAGARVEPGADPEIRAATAANDVTLEFFIHGALCVAFSGQCYISHAHTERSANRGDCSQDCRLPHTLTDDQGRPGRVRKAPAVDEGQQPDTQHRGTDRRRRPLSFKIEGATRIWAT